MSEEEKKAIENLKKDFILMNNGEYAITDDYILYNYISKLQKENEMLKDLTKQAQEDVKIWKDLYDEVKEENKDYMEALVEWVNGERINTLFCVSKDKIREYKEVFKREGSQTSLAIVSILEDLLKENKYI